jgi:hypothetical protein
MQQQKTMMQQVCMEGSIPTHAVHSPFLNQVLFPYKAGQVSQSVSQSVN